MTTSVMWLSPLATEVIIGLSWYIDGTYAEKTVNSVWGGMGFNDLLFLLGFITLLFSGLLAIFGPKIANWMGFNGARTRSEELIE